MSSSRSRRRGAATIPAYPALAPGIQHGLRRLVQDNSRTVASMLDYHADPGEGASLVDTLCEKCAQVMKQQQLSPSSFLARFFSQDVLSDHAATVLQKSGKGSAATLADRIEREWLKDNPLLISTTPTDLQRGSESNNRGKDKEKKKETKSVTVANKRSAKQEATTNENLEGIDQAQVLPEKEKIFNNDEVRVPKKKKARAK